MGLKTDPTSGTYCANGKLRMTKSQAKSAAKRMAQQGRGLNIEAYRCRTCNGWHVGNRRWATA